MKKIHQPFGQFMILCIAMVACTIQKPARQTSVISTTVPSGTATLPVAKTIVPQETVTPTNTSTEIPEATATETPSPSATAQASRAAFGPNIIVNQDDTYMAIDVVDIDSGAVRQLYSFNDRRQHYAFVGWSRSGCEVIIGPKKVIGGSLLRVDLHGKVLDEIYRFPDRLPGVVMGVTLSPKGDWMAYTLGYGEDSPAGMQYNNVATVNLLQDSHEPFTLTVHGGATDVAWSPNGDRLAYSDYDAHHVRQLFVSKPDGSGRVQLTHFDNPKATYYGLGWSPDGTRLSFITADDADQGPDSYLT